MLKLTSVLLIIFLLVALPCLAESYLRLYLPGYTPLINNNPDIYKINNGQNFYKLKPFLVDYIGPEITTDIDLDSLRVTISTLIGDEPFEPSVTMPLDEYYANLETKIYQSSLLASLLTIQQQTTTQTGGLIKDITLDLPNIAIPKSLKRILGNKAGKLNLDGTQRVTMTGTSTKRKIVPIYETELGSRFDLKMRQDTNLSMSGTIGEKIAVLLKYNSNQDETLFDPNNINIKYTGDEDEVVQSLEAGNIALSLSGSRYISYSTSSQGLFGVSSKMKFGPLDLTIIASKEEGQKNTRTYIGQSQADSTIIYSKNFALRTFYYLVKPQDIYALYSSSDTNIPIGWVDNAIKVVNGLWTIQYPDSLPKSGTVRVFVDDGIATNNVASIQGDPVYTSGSEFYTPYYDELIEGTDFITNYNIGTIEILKTIDRTFTIAVQYTNDANIHVPTNSGLLDGILHPKVIRTRNQEYNPTNPYSTWDYQMRNIYSMGLTDIQKDNFSLNVYTENPDRSRNYYAPDSLSVSPNTPLNIYLNLDSSGEGDVNGNDTTVNLASGYIIIPLIRPFYYLGDVLIYQEENESINYDEFKHYISVSGKIGRDVISLGQTGVLKGSVSLKVNGVTQKENVDYLVDYDMGQVTFLSAAGKDPNAKIEINYEFRSGFAVASKTLAGLRADLNISENTKLGGTLIYRSEEVNEKRPKIGNENMKLFLADIDGTTTWKPGFVTRWLNALPLIKTSAESRFTLSGEAALTIPDITGDTDHKDEAYIDDMEGILDSYPLGLAFSTWVGGSKPWQTTLPKGRLNWYNPENVKMSMVYDKANLSPDELNDNITVLAMKLINNPIQHPGLANWCYGGIMKYLGNQLDFSNKKYIELLVKVDTSDQTTPNVILHVDLGDINEDFYTDYGGLDSLNTEDKISDGVLTTAEDVGLDGLSDNMPGNDPNDNASNDKVGEDYPYINGTEGNKILDTEDLDNNGVLNKLDRYLSFSTSISNTNPAQNPYLVDYLSDNKYLLLRIPLNELTPDNYINNSTSGIQPSLKKVSYARIWAESDQTARVLIANAQVVGNKWEDFFIRNADNTIITPIEMNNNNESYLSGITDNKSTHYISPKNTYYVETGKPTLEQSLTLKADNLLPGHKVLLRQKLIDYYSLLSYRKLRFWVYPESDENKTYLLGDSVDIIFRMGSDSLNYYQVRQPVYIRDFHADRVVVPTDTTNVSWKMKQDWWTQLEFDLQDFSQIKDYPDLTGEINKNGRYFSYHGTPTLTNIKEFIFGIDRKNGSSSSYSGTVYYDDIRVADFYEDMGWAGRVTLNSVFADFASLDIDFEQTSQSFNPNIQRGRTQSTTFAYANSLRMTNRYNLDKFFPEKWGLRLPLSLERNYSINYPRYRANSDILRSSIIDPADKKRERNENLNYGANLGISQVTASKSPWLSYTVNKMTLSGHITNTHIHTATTEDSTVAWQGTYNYNVNLPENLLALPVSKNYKFKLIPNSFTNNFTMNSSVPHSYNWETRDTLSGWFHRPQSLPTKTLSTDNGLSWDLTSDFNAAYRIMTQRDLMQRHYSNRLNIGKETEFDQDISADWSPNYFPDIYTLSNSFDTRYTENQRTYSNSSTGTYLTTFLKDGNSTRTARINLTLMNSELFTRISSGHNPTNDKGFQDKEGMDYKKQNQQEFENRKPKDNKQDLNPEDKAKMMEEQYRMEKEKKLELEKQKQDEKSNLDKENETKVKQEVEIKGDLKPSEETKPDSTETKPENAKPQSQGPSLSGADIAYKIIGLMSRIKNVSATYQNIYSQVFTSKTIRPNYLFQLGLPNQVSMAFLDSRNNDNTYTLTSGFTFSRRFDSTMNYSYAITKRNASASNQTVSITFPDIALTLDDVQTLVGLEKVLNSTRINSAYQFVLRQSGDIDWIKPKQETRTYSFNPLLSITTSLTNNLQALISCTASKSDNITDMTTYNIVRITNSQGVTANLSYSFQNSKGIKLPFSKKKINISNDLTSSLDLAYQKNYDTTKGSGPTQVDASTTRISVSPSASYQFDQNIKGGMTSSYEVNRDKKRDDRVRTFSLGIWVEINL